MQKNPDFLDVRPNAETLPSAPSPLTSIPFILLAGLILPGILTYAFFASSEARVLAAIVAILGLMVIVARPFWGLLLFLILVYLRPEETFPALAGMRLTLLVSVTTLSSLFIQKSLGKESLVKTPINRVVLGFIGGVILSTLPMVNPSYTFSSFLDVFKLGLLVLLIMNLVRDERRYRVITQVFIWATAYLAAYSIYLNLTGHALNQAGDIRSIGSGIFGDPNDLAMTIVAGLSLTLSRALTTKSLQRILYVVLVGLMIWTILLTDSRGGMLSLLAAVGGNFLIHIQNKRLGVIAAVVFTALVFGLGSGRMTNFDSSESSANQRLEFWQTGIYMLQSHPLTGVGYGQFQENNDGRSPHNTFVQCFGELGLPGYFCWIGCVYYGFRKPQKKNELAPPPPRSHLQEIAATRLTIIAYLIGAFFLSRAYIPITWFVFCLPVVASQVFYSETDWTFFQKSTRQKDGLKILMLCIGSVVFIQLFIRFS
jgi:O-antigen ligase